MGEMVSGQIFAGRGGGRLQRHGERIFAGRGGGGRGGGQGQSQKAYTYFSNDDTDENVGAEMIADMKPNDDAGTGENVGAKMIADVKPNDDAGENVGAKMIADVSEWLLPVVSIPILLYIFN